MSEQFSWIPIHQEASKRLVQYRDRQEELLSLLKQIEKDGLKIISLRDKDSSGKIIDLKELDPFSFLANFNRGIKNESRKELWTWIKRQWKFESSIPNDFHGIPIVTPLGSWFIGYSDKRKSDDVEKLWQLFCEAQEHPPQGVSEGLFDRCLQIHEVAVAKLTSGLFWINPYQYLSLDSCNIRFINKKKYFPIPKSSDINHQQYLEILDQYKNSIGIDFPSFSRKARLDPQGGKGGKGGEVTTYSKEDALKGLFLDESEFDLMVRRLRDKKNLILQGPPGVGKTYIVKRLAYYLMEKKDDSRVAIVQFHQSYGYEEFIQGYRPDGKSGFDLKNGQFYEFCRKAINDLDKRPHVFIIDEINRGNLSRIFGEVLMLIETDKRGSSYAIPLAYMNDPNKTFYVPKNIYLIGMMNTADRSLSMVDYALRRRFAFIDLKPKFESDSFKEHLGAIGVSPALTSKICNKLENLNKKIADDQQDLGPGFCIGHSFFCHRTDELSEGEWYTDIIKSEIEPLLREYWIDSPKQVEESIDKLLN